MIIILIILLFVFSNNSYSQLAGDIYYLQDSTKSTIHFGPCYIYDEVYETFVLKNIGTGELRMLNVSPSIEIFASPDALTEFEYLRFSPHSPALPFNLNTSDRRNENLVIKYSPLPDLIAEPVGRKTAMIKLGLVDPKDTTRIIIQKTFKLITKKTVKFIDGFDDVIMFDSMFVSSPLEQMRKHIVRNTQNFPIKIVGSNDSLITQGYTSKEFEFEEKQYPISLLPKKTNLVYEIRYRPIDLGPDTAIFKVRFTPREDLKPDSVDFCVVKVIGCGVKQNLELTHSNYDFRRDTIFIGDIQVKKNTRVTFRLKNTGNIPYGIINQNIWDNINNTISGSATISKPFPKAHLFPDQENEIAVDINPDKRGLFLLKYTIENDFTTRNLFGYSSSDTKKEIFLVGRAIEPEIFTNIDTIDFGNVFYSADIEGNCPSSKDTTIRIQNIGNTKLYVNQIMIEDNDKFSVSKNDFSINPNGSEYVTFTFNASYPPGVYYSRAYLINNSTAPKDTLIIMLKAASVPPILAQLNIDNNIKSKPGRIIDIPILLSAEHYKPSIYAKYYQFEVVFNPTLLKYISKTTQGTASEGASVNINDNVKGKLTVQAHSDIFLLPNDTLLILKFKTYLGDNQISELAFQNVVFGSDNCKKIYDLKILNGKYSLDSICGLPLKINPIDFNRPVIISLYPNPVTEKLNLLVNTSKNYSSLLVKITNSYGQIFYEKLMTIKTDGLDLIDIDVNSLSVGVYAISITDGYSIFDTKFFIVER
ncbi:MAG: T9SS type A sorting domain-containing protein [Ignavibacteria bacterium]|nr:T9SS type A sorting domain-containing protein [Ignavibacteria bacterium]